MSVEATTAVWRASKAKGGALLVHLALADHANDDYRAWPSVETLSRKAKLSIRAVQYAIQELEGAGELKVNPSGGPHGVNMYTLTLCRGFYEDADARRIDQATPPAESAPAPQELHPAESAPVQSAMQGGAICDAKGVQNADANCTQNHQNHQRTISEPSEDACARGDAEMAASTAPPEPAIPFAGERVSLSEWAMVQAVCEVRTKLPAGLNPDFQKKTLSFARWCLHPDRAITPQEVRDWGAEWFQDMRRKKGGARVNPPTIGQLAEWFMTMIAEIGRSGMFSRYTTNGLEDDEGHAAASAVPSDPNQSEAERLWARVAADMELRLMRSAWESQVKPVRAVALEGAVLTVEAPSEAVKGWLEERLIGTVRELLAGAAGRAVDVAVVTAGGAA